MLEALEGVPGTRHGSLSKPESVFSELDDSGVTRRTGEVNGTGSVVKQLGLLEITCSQTW